MRLIFGIIRFLIAAVILVVGVLALLPQIPVLVDKGLAGPQVAYLEKHAAPLDLAKADAGFDLAGDLAGSRMVILSEMHGFAMPQALDLALLTHLNAELGMRAYVAELSPAQAMAFNDFVAGGAEAAARDVFDFWAEQSAQWGNKEFFRKLELIRDMNAGLPPERQVFLLGIDKTYDPEFTRRMMSMPRDVNATPGFGSHEGMQAINLALQNAGIELPAGSSRGQVFRARMEVLRMVPGFDEEVFYGLWGLGHGMEVEINGFEPLAQWLDREVFPGQVTSIATFCVGACYNMMPSMALPGPLQGKNGERYILLPMGGDSAYFARTRGIGALKQVAGDARATVFFLDGEETPYDREPALVEMSGYLTPLLQRFEYGGSAAAAYDHVILMQDSPALTPWRGAAHDITGGGAAEVPPLPRF